MSPSRGFTLVELVIAIVVIAAAVAGIAQLLANAAAHNAEPYVRQRGLSVAQAFMDEILRKRWDENTPLGGGCVNTGTGACPGGPAPSGGGTEEATRAQYDDVDDYDTITAQSPPQDATQTPMPGYNGYTVDVSVANPGGAWNGIPAADVKQITVTVNTPTGEDLTLTAYRVNF